MVCPSRILVFPLPLRERVADPSATRVGRVRGSFVFLTMQRTPLPARTSQSSVFVARGSPRPPERPPAQAALPAISLVGRSPVDNACAGTRERPTQPAANGNARR